MPKLLIINVTCNQGSTGKISEQVGLMAKKCGWEVYYAHGARRVNPSKLITIPFSSVRAEYLHALKSLFFDANGLGSVEETKKLVLQIKDLQPDVIHIHNIHGYYMNYKVLFEYLNNTVIPIVLTLHDCWNFTGHCTYFTTAKCEKWISGCFQCPLMKLSPKSLIDRSKQNYARKKVFFATNKNIHIVTVSKWLETVVRKSFLKDKDIRTIQNGVDLKIFNAEWVEKRNKFTIVGVANDWSKLKGLYDFIELSKYLKEDEQIILVGLDRGSKKTELPSNIIPVAKTESQEELARIYKTSDVLVSMSYAETFGMTIAEGTACGIPCVVYDNTAQPSLVIDSTGYIVPTGDVAAVYQAISNIKAKGSTSYRKPCIEHALRTFDKDKCFEKYVKLYEELI